jgi:hypothetical protein
MGAIIMLLAGCLVFALGLFWFGCIDTSGDEETWIWQLLGSLLTMLAGVAVFLLGLGRLIWWLVA